MTILCAYHVYECDRVKIYSLTLSIRESRDISCASSIRSRKYESEVMIYCKRFGTSWFTIRNS